MQEDSVVNLNNMSESLTGSPKKRSWFERTFSPLTAGGIRGNIFLLIITTLGSSFFVLPYCAKKIGILSTLIMVCLSALISYSCSSILYAGFKHTKAKTYSECMEALLGARFGFLSNVIIMIHTVAAVMSAWIFSFKYLRSGIQDIKGIPDNDPFMLNFQKFFFPIGFVLIVGMSFFGSVEKLKKVSLVGIVLILYLVLVFVYLTPDYYSYYNDLGKIETRTVIVDWYMLKVWGICNYMFLNQYAIMPICYTVKDVSFKRITKIIGRTTLAIFAIYLTILFCGYYSQPYDTDVEIFLLRKAIPTKSDVLITYGKILFGFTLFVGVLVKSHFMIIYFEQLIKVFKEVFIGKEAPEASSDDP
jgi:amino acid permease